MSKRKPVTGNSQMERASGIAKCFIAIVENTDLEFSDVFVQTIMAELIEALPYNPHKITRKEKI